MKLSKCTLQTLATAENKKEDTDVLNMPTSKISEGGQIHLNIVAVQTSEGGQIHLNIVAVQTSEWPDSPQHCGCPNK